MPRTKVFVNKQSFEDIFLEFKIPIKIKSLEVKYVDGVTKKFRLYKKKEVMRVKIVEL